jgi:hypothetical protein
MKTTLALTLATLALPLAAQAAEYDGRSTTSSRDYRSGPNYRSPSRDYGHFSYTLGDARLLTADPDRGDDADGLRLSGSILVQENVFLRGALLSADGGGRYGAEEESIELGAGVRHPFSPDVDLVGMASLVHTERDFGRIGEAEGWGPALVGGARAMLAPRVEIGGFIGFSEMFGDGEVAIIGEGLYHFTPNIAAVAGLVLSDSEREANIGGRWNFR